MYIPHITDAITVIIAITGILRLLLLRLLLLIIIIIITPAAAAATIIVITTSTTTTIIIIITLIIISITASPFAIAGLGLQRSPREKCNSLMHDKCLTTPTSCLDHVGNPVAAEKERIKPFQERHPWPPASSICGLRGCRPGHEQTAGSSGC